MVVEPTEKVAKWIGFKTKKPNLKFDNTESQKYIESKEPYREVLDGKVGNLEGKPGLSLAMLAQHVKSKEGEDTELDE